MNLPRNSFLAFCTLALGAVAHASDSITFLTYNGKLGCTVSGISRDGKLIYGSVPDTLTLPATFDGEWHPFKVGFARNSVMTGLSGDNLISFGVGGKAWARKGTRNVELKLFGSVSPNEPIRSSFDGSVAIANHMYSITLWKNGLATEIKPPSGYQYAELTGVSDDGQTLVGTIYGAPTGSVGALWKNDAWVPFTAQGYSILSLNGVTGDGKTILASGFQGTESGKIRPLIIRSGVVQVLDSIAKADIIEVPFATSTDGTITAGNGSYPTFWDADGRAYGASALLQTLGVVPDSVQYLQVTGMSSDGKRFVGTAYTAGGYQPFVLNFESRTWPNILNPLITSRLIKGDTMVAEVNIARPAPRGGVTVTLSTSSPNLVVPTKVVIPTGKTSTTVKVTTKPTAAYDELVDLVATTSTNRIVTPVRIIELAPRVNIETQIPAKLSLTRQLIVNERATRQGSITFTAKSNRPEVLSVPTTVVVEEGQSSADFKVVSGAVNQKTTVRLTFQYGAYTIVKNVVVTP